MLYLENGNLHDRRILRVRKNTRVHGYVYAHLHADTRVVCTALNAGVSKSEVNLDMWKAPLNTECIF